MKAAVPAPYLNADEAAPSARLAQWHDIVTDRRALWLFALFAASIVWIAPRPPMHDLPQHVSQIVLWKDLLLGQSPWSEELRINLLTPYLVPYAIALALSFVMPALVAFKLIISVALLAFVDATIRLRRAVGGDARFDVLAVPSFLGFCYDAGFFSFLVSAPLALYVIRFAYDYAVRGEARDGLKLAGFGSLLLLCHGLIFLFAGLVGGLLHLAHTRSIRRLLATSAPYVVMAIVCIGFYLITRDADAAVKHQMPEWLESPFQRVRTFMPNLASTPPILTALLIGAVAIGGVAIGRMALLPLAIVVALQLFAPYSLFGTDAVSPRFAMFAGPFAAAALVLPRQAKAYKAMIACVVLAWVMVGIKAKQTAAFVAEIQPFEEVLAAAEPGKRMVAAQLIELTTSEAMQHPLLAKHLPNWYTVDKGGFVDFNFAVYHPQVVRFASMPDRQAFGYRSDPVQIDWTQPQLRKWDYFIMRTLPSRMERLLDGPCTFRLVKKVETWALFERLNCR